MNTKTSVPRCPHEATQWLGFNGTMEFFRCLNSGSVVVNQGSSKIAIPAVPTAPARAAA